MILLDTNVVSELMKPAPNTAVRDWLGALGDAPLATTVVTVFEIVHGLQRLPPGRRRTALEGKIAVFVGAHALLPVIEFDDSAAREAGRLRAMRQAAGLGAAASDMMIAGIAAVTGATIATRNASDFAALQITIVNPWFDT